MSYSSIWVMNKDFFGEELTTFRNSWWFTPVACDALYHKYLKVNKERNYIADLMMHKNMPNQLNDLINESETQRDRVLWEIGNQQILFTKDKEFIAKCIIEFAEAGENKYDIGSCKDRFTEVAECVRSINEKESPYFIFKNTSCDDNVERLFRKYDEDEEEYTNASLKEQDEVVAEFVIIEDGRIVDFKTNLNYFKEMLIGGKNE